jgi:hypothetical protein
VPLRLFDPDPDPDFDLDLDSDADLSRPWYRGIGIAIGGDCLSLNTVPLELLPLRVFP